MNCSSAVPMKLKAPVSDDSLLTNKEKIILLRSSKLHSCVFPPWQAEPAAKESIDHFVDSASFRLSEEQAAALDEWRKPAGDRLRFDEWNLRGADLVQDVTTDCSVVASLCAECARSKKLGIREASLIRECIYPQDKPPPNGKYVFKLHFNGCFRSVTIDDRLPCSKSDRVLHVMDRNNPKNFLPALLEKAYLKVRGGYDFPGSNSGTDLWILTGWIPEQLFLQSEDVVPDKFWRRIFNAFNYGDVIITLGTDRLSAQEEAVLGLAGGHAYAVIDLKEQEDRQLFLIKNPWTEGGTWNGYIDPSNPFVRSQPEQSDDLSPGLFWMDLYNVIQYFHTIHLNWNPGLFRFRRDTHFIWDLTIGSSPGSLIRNPQYLMQSREGGTVFLVLTRHFQDYDSQVQVQNGAETASGYLSLSAFRIAGRLTMSRRPSHRSNYLDAPNVLLRFELAPNEPYVIVVSEQELPKQPTSFTISAFSIHSLSKFCPAPEKFGHTITMNGTWTAETGRGNTSYQDYDCNPQFSLSLTETSDVAILIESEDVEFAVHVKLVWAGGKRIQMPLAAKDVYGDSGEYTRGCALAEILQVLPGTYTIVCSTFEAGQAGKFSLRISSMTSNMAVKSIPLHDAGMVTKQLPVAVFSKGIDRLLAPIEVTGNSRLRFKAETISAIKSAVSPLKVSIEFGQGPNKALLLTDDDKGSLGQVRTADLDISPRMTVKTGPGVWLVVKRVSAFHEEEVRVSVLSDAHGVEVGPWGMESTVPIEQLRKQLSKVSVDS